MLKKPFALIPFEPRQVTLAKQQKMKNKKSSAETLETDLPKQSKKDKKNKKSSKESSPLLLAIAEFLEHKGFSKTLVAFKSEALVEQLDGLKGYSLDLEAMYYKYLETSKNDGKANNNSSEKLDSQVEEVVEEDNGGVKGDAAVKSVSKVKKKEHKGNDANDSVEKLTNEAAPDLPVKSKDKKKKSKVSDLSGENIQKVGLEVFKEPADNKVSEAQVDEPEKKSKDKKKKKSKSASECPVESVEQGGQSENGTLDKSAEDMEEKNLKSKDKKRKKNKSTESLSVEGTAVDVEKIESKKRKRLDSEENESQPDDKLESKESKQSKTKGSEDDSLKANALLENDGHAGKKRKMENGLGEQPSATGKSAKKQFNGSAEPKTVNAFRRVDIEKVEFVDERLQDNSYWAKDGADIGYGAKAQEVLGQVRGRDFRHEKTKKKRGSYRGGQIDLQSHSVKFNYSDEE